MMILIGKSKEEWERQYFIDGRELSPDMNKLRKKIKR